MPTESDLRAAMDDVAADAPTGAQLLARMPVPRPTIVAARRRRLLPVLAAVAVLVVATVTAVLAIDRGTEQTVAGGAGGPSPAHPCATLGGRLDFTAISVDHVAGLADTPSRQNSCSGYSQRILDESGKPLGRAEIGFVNVYRAGVFDLRRLHGATKVSGSGVDGYAFTLWPNPHAGVSGYPGDVDCVLVVSASGEPPANTRGSCTAYHAVAWKYAPGAWAMVGVWDAPRTANLLGSDPVAKLLSVAAATDTEHPVPIRVPMRSTGLPAGIRIVNVADFADDDGRSTVVAGFGVVGRRGCAAGSVCDQDGEIALSPRSARPRFHGTPVQVDGRTAYLEDRGNIRPDARLSLWDGHWTVEVGKAGDTTPSSVLVAIARSLHYAGSTTDRSTWFALAGAFGN